MLLTQYAATISAVLQTIPVDRCHDALEVHFLWWILLALRLKLGPEENGVVSVESEAHNRQTVGVAMELQYAR